MAYIESDAVEFLAVQPSVDILLTHQGPAGLQGDHGSETLDRLVDIEFAKFWFHGHSTPVKTPMRFGESKLFPWEISHFQTGSPD